MKTKNNDDMAIGMTLLLAVLVVIAGIFLNGCSANQAASHMQAKEYADGIDGPRVDPCEGVAAECYGDPYGPAKDGLVP